MLSDFNELLKKYARLIAETGVATEKGHTVVLQISVEQAPLAQDQCCFCRSRCICWCR